MALDATEIAPGIVEIDTLLGGWRQATAGYLLTGPAPVLIETGSQTSAPVVIEALGALGLGPGDLAGIAVTHIHLDHAGGVGDLAAAFPSATIYVHELGARHLVDPSRLIDSAGRVYGALLDDLYGRMTPSDAARVRVLADGETVVVGPGALLEAIDSPGHAKHHLGYLAQESGVLFCGDAVGVALPGGGALRPATPPPDFDLEAARESLHRFAGRRPAALALTHYGILPGAPEDLLAGAEETLLAWAGEAERAITAGEDVAGALSARFAADYAALEPDQRARIETLNGIHSNAAGLRRYFERRDRAADAQP